MWPLSTLLLSPRRKNSVLPASYVKSEFRLKSTISPKGVPGLSNSPKGCVYDGPVLVVLTQNSSVAPLARLLPKVPSAVVETTSLTHTAV